MENKKVIIVGGGFGGLLAAKEFKDTDFDATIIDKTNHHLFQPLLYQVAAAALSPADIAIPIRSVFRNQKNIKVLLDEVISVDKENNTIKLSNSELKFDHLILSPGARHSYFGNDTWEKYAPGLKTLSDALKIRELILNSLEAAEKELDLNQRKKYLTFVVIGGGPTGVELAGAIAEIAKKTMIRDYKNFCADDTIIVLVEALPRILTSYSPDLSDKAKEDLVKMGVDIQLNKKVTDVNENGVQLGDVFIESKNVIWAAGNVASPLLKTLNIDLDKAGRAIVESDCSVPGYSNIFVVGDAAIMKDDKGEVLPGVAPVAMQQGRFVGKLIKSGLDKSNRKKFTYVDKGSMATIGKAKAVAMISGLKLSGLIAWLAWSFVHIFFLIGFRNRFRVFAEWIWYYITNRQGTRLITNALKERK
ncbi:MAG: NAD(P)/FAD-dependent oxidoreductase [Ignavibacterium sp.]|nr:NAD(P)/FAD-dependent oxidoreductase [Ignavibacterium sp.]